MKKSIRFSRMQQPPLIKQLKGILSEYPDGGQILKELIQNAEDAGAREVKILHDNRRINNTSTEAAHEGSVTTPIYTKFFKGPAICVYNDAVFSEKDWEGIQMIYSSVKEEDPMKVGRFGLGFKSVFHITDFPCVISGDRVLLIDPQQPTEKVNATLDICALEEYTEEGLDADAFWRALDDTFGLGRNELGENGFRGTLFWFPLREIASNLSETLYTERKVKDLFDSFALEASNILLFMKNIENISLHFRDAEMTMRELLKIEIEDKDGEIRQSRNAFKERIKNMNETPDDADINSTLQMVIHTSSFDIDERQKWLVVNYFVRDSASEGFKKLIQDEKLNYSPYVGVATPLNEMIEEFEGHVFCFLPLPREGERLTGLPVHVNGFFALSQNRHHMKWETEEQEGKHIDEKSILWNKALIEEALPMAYELLILESIKLAEKNSNNDKSVKAVYNAMPVCKNSERKTHKRWMVLENKLYELLEQRNIAYAAHENEWITIDKASFATFRSLSGCSREFDVSMKEAVIRCLHDVDLRYTKLPSSLFDTLQMHFPYIKDLTPGSLMIHLQKHDGYREISCEDKIQVLEYLLLDDENLVGINGLELLPLASNGWAIFDESTDPIFLCCDTAMKMFPGSEEKFVMESQKLGHLLSENFEKICDSEFHQIQRLNVKRSKTLLKQTLIKHIGSDEQERLTPTSSLTSKWLENVWRELIGQKMVKDFKDIPLVPVLVQGSWTDPRFIELVRLSDLMILKYSKEASLEEGLCGCLDAMKVKILPSLPEWIPFECIQDFVYRPTNEGIVTLLGAVYRANGDEVAKEFNIASQVNSMMRKALITFVSSLSYIEKDVVNLLCKLKLFRVVRTMEDKRQFSSVADVPRYLSEDINFPGKLELPFSCIKVDKSDEHLVRQLEAEIISVEYLVLTTIKNLLHHEKNEQNLIFMTYFIENFHLFETNSIICKDAAQIPFLEVGEKMYKPSDLFDPSSSSLRRLLSGEYVFPERSHEYSNEEIRVLRRLGLKGKDKIDAPLMLQVANTLNVWSAKYVSNDNLSKKAAEFMNFLIYNPELLDQKCYGETKLGDALMSVTCIPVTQKAPADYPEGLPWFSKSLTICRPREAKIVDHSLLTGGTMPIVECVSDKISKAFNWNVAPNVHQVMNQLFLIRQHYNVKNKPDYMRVVQRIYKRLYECREEVLEIQVTLENEQTVWTGFGFELPRNVVINRRQHDLDLRPYFYQLPEEIQDMDDLFLQLGCNLEENYCILLNVLQKIKEKHDNYTKSSDLSSSRDLEIVIEILKALAAERKKDNFDIDDSRILMLVDCRTSEKLCLQYVPSCIFDDDQDELDSEEEKTIYVVSENVPKDVARILGVKSLKKKTILGATEGISFECGQHEALTTRINTLLIDGYKDGLSVPKELIQNADDANATVVKFLYDERQNNDARRTGKLLTADLSECQGPALWIYNDSQFTEQDLVNITKLNGATKADLQDKIGKFGLGFCSVYNLTDVPSFISGKDIVIFDPHETYIREVTRGTGLRVRLSERQVVKQNIDQFKPYNTVFGCNILDSSFTTFSGTLFRLPFRTEHQALNSEISKKAYTKKEAKTFLRKFVENAGDILLFTQHVKTVEMYHLSKDETNPSQAKLLFSIDKEFQQMTHGKTATNTQSVLERIPSILNNNYDFNEIHYITMTRFFSKSSDLELSSEISNMTLVTYWIVSWALGTDKALQLSKTISEKGAVPLSAVAVLMKDEGNSKPLMLREAPSGFYTEGHLFCFLPLPIKTGLHFHINGCFSVDPYRRRLLGLNEDDKGNDDKDMWNQALMEDSTVASYIQLLLCLSRQCKENYCYHSLWPLGESKDIQKFKQSFFKALICNKLKLFRGKSGWLSIDEVVFLDPVIRINTLIGNVAFNFLSLVPIRQGKILIELPNQVLKSFQECQFDDKAVILEAMITEEDLVLHFLSTISSEIWENRFDERNKLILYSLKSKSKKATQKMHETRCIPSQPNDVLCRPDELVNPRSKLAAMFDDRDEKYPSKVDGFWDSQVIARLISLGMNDKNIPTEMLLERCMSIEKLLTCCGNCAQERCLQILKYCGILDVNHSLDADTISKLKHVLLLPVMPCPNSWTFSWDADNKDTLISEEKCAKHLKQTETIIRFEKPFHLYRQTLYVCIGSVRSFVHESYLNPNCLIPDHLFNELGLQSELKIDLLLQQLKAISEQYTDKESQFNNMEKVSKAVFESLTTLIGDKSEEEISKIPSFHNWREKPLIVIGNELIMPQKVAFNVKAEFPPELYCLREFDSNRKKLFKAFGVEEYFSTDFLISILKGYHTTWFERKCTDIEQVARLLSNLSESMQNEKVIYKDMKGDKENIVAPDTDGYLRPTQELVIEDPAYTSSDSIHILHGNIPPDTGRALGVKSKQQKIVEKFSSMFFEPFGQNESLVTRLTGILEDYPCDSSIMKELIQNADDAGATEIYFIKNYISHSTEKIFGKEGIQGPSLCIYNDSYFTEKYFRGIRSLGIGSKREDPLQTGQYGIGFNAVYHLTDIPSFLTKGPGLGNDGQICIFDPLQKYIAEYVTNENPGMKCDVCNMKESFPNMLLGYPVMKSIETSGRGTIFRLPLRQYASKISENVVSVEKMDSLIDDFKEEMFESLLFLKNIKCIKVLNNSEEGLTEELFVNATLSEENAVKREKYFSKVTEAVKETIRTRHQTLSMQPIETSYKMKVEDNRDRIEHWLVVNRFGNEFTETSYDIVISALKDKEIGLIPMASVALRWPDVDLKNCSTKEEQNSQSPKKAFCFLPLPLNTGLPYHVNAHFALDKARAKLKIDGVQKLWNAFLIAEVLSRVCISAIKYMKTEFVCPYFAECLSRTTLSAVLDKYNDIFPLWENSVDTYWKFLVNNIYRIIVEDDIPIFPSVREETGENDVLMQHLDWVSLSRSENEFKGTFNLISEYVLTYYSRSTYEFRKAVKQHVEKTLKKLGLELIETPLSVKESIRQSGIGYIPVSSPDFVITFLKSLTVKKESICNFEKIDGQLSETSVEDLKSLKNVLIYVMIDKTFKDKVSGLPLCLTNDCVLRSFNTDEPLFCSSICRVLTGSSRQFIHSELVTFIDQEVFYTAGVIKQFSVDDLVSHLPETFNPSLFATGKDVSWNKKTGEPVQQDSLLSVFSFIYGKSLETMKERPYHSILNHQLFRSNVRKLNEWSFIPVCTAIESHMTNKLLPVSQMSHMFHKSSGNQTVCDIIERFNIPTLDTSTFKIERFPYALQKMLPSTEYPIELLECLCYYNSRIKKCVLTSDEALIVLSYLNSKLDEMKKKMQENSLRNKLRSLPLYVSYQGNVVSTEEFTNAIILPHGNIPSAGIDAWAKSTGILIVRYNDRLHSLFSFLNFPIMSELKVYSQAILPNVHGLPRHVWLTHIEYIKDNIIKKYDSEKQSESERRIISQLKDVAFVRVSNTNKRVYDFYDHRSHLFSCMLTKDYFLPEEYREDTWLSFMEILGLVTEPGDEMLIDFARNIEAKLNCPINEITAEQSEALIKCLFKGKWKKMTLDRMKRIRFVVPHKVDKERARVANQPENGNTLVCFSGGVSNVHTDLCWSVMNILSRVPFSKEMVKALGIYDFPPIEKIVQHCQNVADVFKTQLEKRTICPDFVKHQMTVLYQELLKQFDISMQQKFQVTHIIFDPDDEKMLPFKQVVTDLKDDEEVRPYLYKLSKMFGPYEELFCLLGSHKKAMSSDYSKVLDKVKEEFGDDVVPPNVLECVKKTLVHIVKLSEKELKPFQLVKILYLPDRNNFLVSSKTLTIANNDDIEERLKSKLKIRFFAGFKALQIDNVRDPILPFVRWPENLRPDILTNVVSEHISTDYVFQEVCVQAKRLETCLRSPPVIEGILRIVKHQMKLNNISFEQNFEETLMTRLTSLRITKVSGLQTFLSYKGQRIDGTDAKASCFIKSQCVTHSDDTKIKQYELYFQRDAQGELLTYLLAEQHGLVKLIDLITDGKLDKDMTFCLSTVLRLIEQPFEIKKTLDRYRIDAYDIPATFNVSMFPKPGTYVEEKFHPFLEQSISTIKPHEYMYVALEVEEEDDDDDNTDPVYIYANIICENKRRHGDSILGITYNVDIGHSDGFKTAPLFRLYKFAPKKTEDVSSLVVYDIEPIGSLPLDENFRRIRHMLIEAWTMGDADRKRVIRRLLKRWHPDRNKVHREYAERLFNYVNEVIISLENGKQIDGTITRNTGMMPPDMSWSSFRSASYAASSRGQRYAAAFHYNMRDYNISTHTGNYAHHMAEVAVVRHVGEAKRWHRQAVEDFKAAKNDMNVGEQGPSFNWACFKCHQACEKSLKAAWFAKNANMARRKGHCLSAIARGLDDGSLMKEASNLESLTGDYASMRYPDAIAGRHQIPSEMIDRTQAEKAFEVTKGILDMVAELID